MHQVDEQYARQLDQEDQLAAYRDQFLIHDPETIYLDGNSLGRLPRRTPAVLQQLIEIGWGQTLIRGWNEGWLGAARRIGAKIARLIGAQEHEVIVADSTSVNMFKLAMAALAARPDRNKVVTDVLNFPSDRYVLEGVLQSQRHAVKDAHLELVTSADGQSIDSSAWNNAIDSDTALVALSHVAYQSGAVHDMHHINRIAHQAGALIVWDLCHSVGVLPIELNKSDADLAVGCTYKYLNGGPGSPAFLYVRESLQQQLRNPIWGWFGSREQFQFRETYEPAAGIDQYQVGTPPVLSMLATEPGIDLVLEAGIDRIREKSMRQSEYLFFLWQKLLAPLGVQWGSPESAINRGSHVALLHPEGWRITQALIGDMRVIPDFRTPTTIRFGIAPLYVSYLDLYHAVLRLRTVLTEHRYERYPRQRHGVP